VIQLLVFWNPLTNCLKVIIDWLRNMQNDLLAYYFLVQNALLCCLENSSFISKYEALCSGVYIFIRKLHDISLWRISKYLYIKTQHYEKVQLFSSIQETEMIELLTTAWSSLTKRKLSNSYLLSCLMFCPNPSVFSNKKVTTLISKLYTKKQLKSNFFSPRSEI